MKKNDMDLNYNSNKDSQEDSKEPNKRRRFDIRIPLFYFIILIIGIEIMVIIARIKDSNDKQISQKNSIHKDLASNLKNAVLEPYVMIPKENSTNTLNDMNTGEVEENNQNAPQEESVNTSLQTEAKAETDSKVATDTKAYTDAKVSTKAKGIYVTASKANGSIDELIALVEETELNTMVIDIKDDEGNITYLMDNEEAIKMNVTKAYIKDINRLVQKLKEKDIYLIARIVAFKDPALAENRPDLALKNKDGTIFRDKDGLAWVNPYKREVWDYLIGISKSCAEIGFDEVNFDYIRFSTDKGMSNVDFGAQAKNKTKIQTITQFVKYAYKNIKPMGINVSADVFGAIISSSVDAKIVGQSYIEMAKNLDYICPMIYPSHYGDGYYGIDYPDTKPYQLITEALKDSNEVLGAVKEGDHIAIVRPWLQDFTASWLKHYIKYGKEEVRQQINAVYDSGCEEWLLWNSSMKYTENALEKE